MKKEKNEIDISKNKLLYRKIKNGLVKATAGVLLSAVLAVGGIIPAEISRPIDNMVLVEAATVNVPVPSNISAGKVVTDGPVQIKFKEPANTQIYWSFNGNMYVRYDKENPVELDKNRTIYTYAVKNGVESKIKKYTYKLVPGVKLSVNEGTYKKAQTVKITSVEGAKIYYTLDGSKPTTKSAKYTKKGINIDKTCTLRLLVKKTGWTAGYYEFDYTVNLTNIFDELNDYTSKPYYSLLNDNEKAVYKAIFDGYNDMKEYTDELRSYKVSPKRAGEIIRFVICENPQLFWVDDGRNSITSDGTYISKVKLYYTNTKEEVQTRQKQLQKKAKSILNDANTSNTFELIKYFHDTICELTTYDKGNISSRNTAGTDDIFLDGRGLCTAYARAFNYLCQLSGIPCINIEGDASSQGKVEGHCWNKLCIDDEWYNMDVCWDDQNEPVYDYFCVTDSKIVTNHFSDSFFKISDFAATATKYNYLNYMGYEEYTDADSAYKALISEAAKQLAEKREANVTVYFVETPGNSITNAIVNRLNERDGSSSIVWKDIKNISKEAEKVIGTTKFSASFTYSGRRVTLLINRL